MQNASVARHLPSSGSCSYSYGKYTLLAMESARSKASIYRAQHKYRKTAYTHV